MPVAVARKIEHRLYLKQLDLDIQVRPIALTADQCDRYSLPRTPIKETERRASFEDRHGEGATELDALESSTPSELRSSIVREIERYFDSDLDERMSEMVAEIRQSLSAINRVVHAEHRTEIVALESKWKEIAKEYARRIAQWQKQAKPVWRWHSE